MNFIQPTNWIRLTETRGSTSKREREEKERFFQRKIDKYLRERRVRKEKDWTLT